MLQYDAACCCVSPATWLDDTRTASGHGKCICIHKHSNTHIQYVIYLVRSLFRIFELPYMACVGGACNTSAPEFRAALCCAVLQWWRGGELEQLKLDLRTLLRKSLNNS